MDELDKDRLAVGWFAAAWDDYMTFLPRLLPLALVQAAVSAAALPMIKAWHSLLPAAAWSVLVTAPLGVGATLVYIRAARGEAPRLRDLFAGFPIYGRALGVTLALGLLTVGGMMAFIIPGIIIYLTFCFSEFLVVDRGCGVKESFAASRAMAEGWRRRLLPIALLGLLLNLLAPDVFVVVKPFSAPDVKLDLRAWTVVAHALKTLVFAPWLDLALARAYIFLGRPLPAGPAENA